MKECTAHLVAPEFAIEGQPVPIALVIVNTTDKPVDLHLQGRDIDFNVTVTGEGGKLVWERQTGMTQAILRLDTLAPHGEIRLEDVWSQVDTAGNPVAAGFYTLQGLVPTDREPLVTQDHLLHITRS